MTDSPSEGTRDDAFGDLLFQRKHGRWGFGIGAIVLFLGTGFLWLVAANEARKPQSEAAAPAIIGAICLLFAVLCGWRFSRGDLILSFFQKGVTRSYAARFDRLPYESIESLSYSLVRQYMNGAYTGTILSLKMVPSQELGIKPFVFGGKHREKLVGAGFFKKGHFEGTDELDGLRDHVSGMIAARMLERIQKGESVPWLGKVTLRRDGFQVRDSRYSWADVENVTLEKGRFAIKVRGKFLAAVSATAGAANFYPGFLVLQYLRQQSSPSAASSN